MSLEQRGALDHPRIDNPYLLVVNPGHPELDHLSAEAASQGALFRYIRPYTTTSHLQRWIPAIGQAQRWYERTLGRRVLPEAIPPHMIQMGALTDDVGQALFSRLGTVGIPWARTLARACSYHRARALDAIGARLAPSSRVVVADFGAGLSTFHAIHAARGMAVLNYPIAHHRYAEHLLAEEARLVPNFASTFEDMIRPTWLTSRMDEECREADMILVGSSFARDSFLHEGFTSEQIGVVPYGVDVDQFKPMVDRPDNKSTFIVIFVGQIGQRKGISYLLEAYKQFQKADTRLILAGSLLGDRQAFEPYANLFHHIPPVPRSFIVDLYQDADVLVLPSLVEGMPLVVAEAMACGVPVIVTPNGPGDLVRDGVDGYVVPIRDSEAILGRLTDLYDNDALRARIGTNARERVNCQTWSSYKASAMALLSHLLERVNEL